MNMMTRERWTRDFPLPPTIPVLLAQVDRACFVAKVTSTSFGVALGDGGLIHRIRKGRRPRAETHFRIQAHAERLLEAKVILHGRSGTRAAGTRSRATEAR